MTLATALADLKASLDQGNEALTTKHFRLLIEALSGTLDLQGQDVTGVDRLVVDKLVVPKSALLTIASGVITVTDSFHRVDTEAAAASDDLVTIDGGVDGQFFIMRTASSARDVVLRTGGNILCTDGFIVAASTRFVLFIFDGDHNAWVAVTPEGARP